MPQGLLADQVRDCPLALARIGAVSGLPGFGCWGWVVSCWAGWAAVALSWGVGGVMIMDHDGLSW